MGRFFLDDGDKDDGASVGDSRVVCGWMANSWLRAPMFGISVCHFFVV